MTIPAALLQLAALHEAAAEIPELLQALRAAYSNEEWAVMEEQHPTVADLISACCGIEDALERGV
jgi:hypothetical protein